MLGWRLRERRPAYALTLQGGGIGVMYLTLFAAARLFGMVPMPLALGVMVGLVVFSGLQAGLVKGIPYGLAFSAVALGLVYTALATRLWRRREASLRPLVEAFLSLGVIFASLAVPLALSGGWTAVTWSLEGAGLVWIGLRQRRWTARVFGLMLHIGSGVQFLIYHADHWPTWIPFGSLVPGGLTIGATGLFCAFLLERHAGRLHRLERHASAGMMVWGLLWWFGTGLAEIDRRLERQQAWLGRLTFVGLSTLAMGVLQRRLDWMAIRWPAMGLLPTMLLTACSLEAQHLVTHPLQGGGLVAWPSAFLIHIFLLRRLERAWHEPVVVAWHVAARSVHHFGHVPYDWRVLFRSDLFHAAIAVVWGTLALGCMVTSTRLHHRVTWFVGAGLLGMVVVKLFVVDLAGAGTISRIVSFLAVGGLTLVVGFFSPLPPAESKGRAS